jgi:hypothetical protein
VLQRNFRFLLRLPRRKQSLNNFALGPYIEMEAAGKSCSLQISIFHEEKNVIVI